MYNCGNLGAINPYEWLMNDCQSHYSWSIALPWTIDLGSNIVNFGSRIKHVDNQLVDCDQLILISNQVNQSLVSHD
jgi:hypothetical protein